MSVFSFLSPSRSRVNCAPSSREPALSSLSSLPPSPLGLRLLPSSLLLLRSRSPSRRRSRLSPSSLSRLRSPLSLLSPLPPLSCRSRCLSLERDRERCLLRGGDDGDAGIVKVWIQKVAN